MRERPRKKGLTYVCKYAILKMPTGKRHRKEMILAARKTTTSSEVKNRWNAAHYTRLTVVLDKDTATAYKAKCERAGMSYSDVPKEAIHKFLREP